MCSLEKLKHSRLFSYEVFYHPRTRVKRKANKKNPVSASMLDGG
jgi:hypothetical protein